MLQAGRTKMKHFTSKLYSPSSVKSLEHQMRLILLGDSEKNRAGHIFAAIIHNALCWPPTLQAVQSTAK